MSLNRATLPTTGEEWIDNANNKYTVVCVANVNQPAEQPVTVIYNRNGDLSNALSMHLTEWQEKLSLYKLKPVPGIGVLKENNFSNGALPAAQEKLHQIIDAVTLKLWKLGVSASIHAWTHGTVLSNGWERNAVLSTTIQFQRTFGDITGDEAKVVHTSLSKWLGLPEKEEYKEYVDFDRLVLHVCDRTGMKVYGYKEGKSLFIIDHVSYK